MDEQPSYFAIIPASIRYDKRLKRRGDEKVLFAEITALANKKGYCFATNNYFAELYDVDKVTVSRWINHLKSLGYLKVQINRNENQQIIDRKIYPIVDPINRNVNTPVNTEVNNPINRNVKGNSTSINNTSNNNLSRSPATSSKKKEKSKLKSSYDEWTTKTNHKLTDLAMYYTKTRVANEQNELAYFNTLMEDWQSRSLKTVAEVKNYLNNKKGNYSNKPKPNAIQPSWLHDDDWAKQPEVSEEELRQVEEMLKKFD